jgi:hydroxyacyl-ACP dehydratase HTD2-like protein with hotdog domain
VNLRIAPEHIRFRISEQELHHIHQQGSITQCTRVSDTLSMHYTLELAASTDRIMPALLHLQTRQEEHVIGFLLTIGHEALAQLLSPLQRQNRIRESLTLANGDFLTVDLEVDLHSKKGV